MNDPKFQYGQMVHHKKADVKGIVCNIQVSPAGGWLYGIFLDGRGSGPSGWDEELLSSEDVVRPAPAPINAGLKVSFSSLDAWVSEAAKMIPPEEGHGVQPTIDLLNHITMHRNAMIEAIDAYCDHTKILSPFRG